MVFLGLEGGHKKRDILDLQLLLVSVVAIAVPTA